MPPLTLEQVLARSMRLPRSRSQRQVSQLYKNSSVEAATTQANTFTKALIEPNTPPPAAAAVGGGRGAAASARQERLNFFDLMERDEAARQAGRLTIHRSTSLVRNSADLTNFLNAARRTGDWEDGLRIFAQATALPAFTTLLEPTPTHQQQQQAQRQSAALPLQSGVNPNVGHVMALLDMSAAAERYDLAERIGAFFAPAFPEAFTRMVELLVARQALAAANTMTAASSSSSSSSGWRAGLTYLTERCPLPAADIPVEAFNVCLRGCEAAKDWRGALAVVRAMGPNPLQGWTAQEEKEETERPGDPVVEGAEASMSPTTTLTPTTESSPASEQVLASVSTPPSPNVVTYATLIATLEQAGKDRIASEVLNRLPPLEKEEITASYAALIVVWSNQVQSKHRRRF